MIQRSYLNSCWTSRQCYTTLLDVMKSMLQTKFFRAGYCTFAEGFRSYYRKTLLLSSKFLTYATEQNHLPVINFGRGLAHCHFCQPC